MSALRSAIVRAEDGFTLVELLVAVLVMTIGVIALTSTFDSSRASVTSAEMHDVGASIGQKEIERVTALPWKQIALSQTPTANAGAGPADPTYYISAGPCDVGASLPVHSPCYQWDWTNTANVEPLVIDSTNGDTTANPLPWTAPVSTSDATVRLSGEIYRYVTWVRDANCSSSTCGGQSDYKRLTVAVTVNGLPKPIWLSTLVQNTAGQGNDPLNGGGASCSIGGGAVPCTN